MNFRLRAAGLHLAGSAVVALVAWWLVFRLWYPSPLSALAGGAALFMLLMVVDLVLGPTLTAVIANPNKPRVELFRDIGVVLTIQIAALVYGLHIVAVARPVAIAFEIDFFRVVSASEVDSDSLHQAPADLQSLSWTGPRTLAAVRPASAHEQLRTIDLGFAGIPLAALPAYWRDYGVEASKAWQLGQPVASLIASAPEVAATVNELARKAGLEVSALRALPLLARRGEGTVLLAPPDARIVGLLPVPMPQAPPAPLHP